MGRLSHGCWWDWGGDPGGQGPRRTNTGKGDRGVEQKRVFLDDSALGPVYLHQKFDERLSDRLITGDTDDKPSRGQCLGLELELVEEMDPQGPRLLKLLFRCQFGLDAIDLLGLDSDQLDFGTERLVEVGASADLPQPKAEDNPR